MVHLHGLQQTRFILHEVKVIDHWIHTLVYTLPALLDPYASISIICTTGSIH